MACETPVALFVHKRPDFARRVFAEIRKARPKSFILVSDGARSANETDDVNLCRSLLSEVDWPCDTQALFSDRNMGCKGRFFSALDELFDRHPRLIVLEDDCVPRADFFGFCNWALDAFEKDHQISLVSGSNLSSQSTLGRNGFSRYMNCWGWAGWARGWREVNQSLGLRSLDATQASMLKAGFKKWEVRFWSEVFKHSIVSPSIWDFYVQEAMLRTHTLSVYPRTSLIHNIGFDDRSTHTGGKVPPYVKRAESASDAVLGFEPNFQVEPDWARDRHLAREIWSCTPSTAFRLQITNTLRYLAA